jgi:hypothetical protein
MTKDVLYGKMESFQVSDSSSESNVPLQMQLVDAGSYYSTYHGHDTKLLKKVLTKLRNVHGESGIAIFLAGDSSLDNKTWIFNQGAPAEYWRPATAHAPATNGYQEVLKPSRMVCDVTYWMNQILADLRANAFAVNTAIEATLLASRVGGVQCCIVPSCGGLYSQERFLRDKLRPSDMLVICIGGNDIALAPSIFTVLALVLIMLTPWCLLVDCHPGVMYFIGMFKYQIQCYADRLTSVTRPAKIGICMIYNLDEANRESWANVALCLLCYCCFPSILQNRINLVFERCITEIDIEGSEVVPIRLADALDGKCTQDYHQRVEPSVVGGQKMARLILHRLGWPCETAGYRYEKPGSASA